MVFVTHEEYKIERVCFCCISRSGNLISAYRNNLWSSPRLYSCCLLSLISENKRLHMVLWIRGQQSCKGTVGLHTQLYLIKEGWMYPNTNLALLASRLPLVTKSRLYCWLLCSRWFQRCAPPAVRNVGRRVHCQSKWDRPGAHKNDALFNRWISALQRGSRSTLCLDSRLMSCCKCHK